MNSRHRARVPAGSIALLVAVAIAVALAACDVIAPQATSRLTAGQYSCVRFPFNPPDLDRVGGDEGSDDPKAVALNAFLDLGGDVEELPNAGWHLVGSDAANAEYVSKAPNTYWTVSLADAGAGWSVTSWGGCSPELVMPPDVRVANWQLDSAAPVPDATSTLISLLVFERSCASGQSAAGRIVGPELAFEADRILIAFGVTRLAGDQECSAPAPTGMTIDLGQAIGDRQLVDVGVWPPTTQSGG